MNTTLNPIEELITLDETEFHGDVACESHFCAVVLQRGPHEAHVNARMVCGHGVPVCRDRVAWYKRAPVVFCIRDGVETPVVDIILTDL